MILKKDITIKVYEVIANYKTKVENAPYISILQFASEKEYKIDSELLQKELLKPMSEKACENLLDKLTITGYFTKKNKNEYNNNPFSENKEKFEYTLTDLGATSAETEKFYEQKQGLLKLHIAEYNEFIEQKIVKIEEIWKYDDLDKYSDILSLNKDLRALQNPDKLINLKKGSYILENFKEKCKILEEETTELIFTAGKENSVVQVLDFENIEDYTEQEIINTQLENTYWDSYFSEKQILKVNFDSDNLIFSRNITIEEPQISNTIFNEIEIENIKVSPENSIDASAWYIALLKQQINTYFLSDADFNDFANKIAKEFELFVFELQNTISRKQLIANLNSEKDFYKKAKLETIDFLNY